MPGQRFIDRLIADTLSERYRPSEVDEGHQRLMDAGVRIPHDEISFVRAPLQECEETLKLTSGGLDDHDCLRPPLDRLCDWFAGLFSVDAVAMPID